MENFDLLDIKLQETLSGLCLTSIREQNKKIVEKYDEISEKKLLEIKKDFQDYIKNYLILKKYKIDSFFEDGICASFDGKNYEFLIDFDWGEKQGPIKLKILDKGSKIGISKYEYKFLFIISIGKGFFVLINNPNLKNQIKENRQNFNIITESSELFKSQFISFDLNNLNQKTKIFQLK